MYRQCMTFRGDTGFTSLRARSRKEDPVAALLRGRLVLSMAERIEREFGRRSYSAVVVGERVFRSMRALRFLE